MAKNVDLPIVITENGIPIDIDHRRIEYLRQAVKGVARCLLDELDVRGYFYWSAFDNFEWGTYEKTYGLIAIDRESLERRYKPSARFYGDLAANNQIEID